MRYKIDYEYKIKKHLEENNKSFSYYIDTMGCALNENDSMKYKGMLETMGLKKAKSVEKANIIVFNTCCIRENAENKLFGRVGKLKSRKIKSKDDVVICIVGCMTEQQHIINKIKKSYSFVDVIIGTRNMQNFAKKLYLSIVKNLKEDLTDEKADSVIEDIPIIYDKGYKASVSIIYGCNNFCSYCIVPYVRGRERSRNPKDILKEIEHLTNKGYKEITLLGQNVNSYGNDFKDKKFNFVDLLKKLEKIKKLEIIRFISPHPKDFSDELIDVIAKSKKISKQIHLPLQSGSTKILKEMNRKYTKEQYLNLVEKIKKKIEEVSFSTDVIVGFPKETEKDFKETLDVIKQVEFSQVYMFCYSRRKGTVADKSKEQIPNEIKGKRLERLKKESERIIDKQNDLMINKTYDILVEGKSKKDKTKYVGRTLDNKIVIFNANEDDVGQIKKIEIISNNKWYLTGKIKDK